MENIVPVMAPVPGERLVRFVGDRVRFVLREAHGRSFPAGWQARLRTNFGRADILRREIIEAHAKSLPCAGAAWRDIPMRRGDDGWWLELPLAEVGWFKAKAYALDARGWQHWPAGPDLGVAVHPNAYRTANTIYCAFPRLFGPTLTTAGARDDAFDKQLQRLDQQGYTVIPPSGKLRDLIPHLPHVIETLGCRILHLLPVNPPPTTYARFGRFGSPYASLDLTAVDPALVVFDRHTTGVDQFRELACAAHRLGGRVFLDIVINHTGWASALQERHPEWFLRRPDGTFVSPGAWGVTWEDLVELNHDNVPLWDELAEVFLSWCRRGVDGFRCDAGYMVPMPAWQYITARVQQEFPETIFLLEGLGGAWDLTEALLTEGGLQWAYSELFQNYSGPQVTGYLDHSVKQSQRVGLLVHYSETHDNNRLAARGRAWSLLRNRLCALTSVSGGFGFTCGVEWLASEKIDVHASPSLAWGGAENCVAELAQLNRLLAAHPCFFDGAQLTRLNPPDSPVYALRRASADGQDIVLVLVNADPEREQTTVLDSPLAPPLSALRCDLLGQPLPAIRPLGPNGFACVLAPAACYCLAPAAQPVGLGGEAYRRARAQAAWAVEVLSRSVSIEQLDGFDWRQLAEHVERSPVSFLAAASHLSEAPLAEEPATATPLADLIRQAEAGALFPKVVVWTLLDRRRVTPVPPGHWLLIQDTAPFRADLELRSAECGMPNGAQPAPGGQHRQSIAVRDGHVACFAPSATAADATLSLERYADADPRVVAALRFLAPGPLLAFPRPAPGSTDLSLLTNGRGGMARLCADLGRVTSKYDCVLGANLHPSLPVDRHVLVKRLRAWVNADGFISPLDAANLAAFAPGPPAAWRFVANAGDARTVEIELVADMLDGRNTTVFHFRRPTAGQATGKPLPADADVRLTVRCDIEDRNFHWETKRNGGAEHHFVTHTRPLEGRAGFAFTPAPDRQLRAFADAGTYHPQPEWCENLPHPIEQSRGQTGSGDAYSPGWFDLPLPAGANVTLVLTADPADPAPAELRLGDGPPSVADPNEAFSRQLLRAVRAFVVRRDRGKTVIAGYPWFLDWGRDSLLCARGLLAAGLVDDVRELLATFARFEDRGTLPNTIHGQDASNRDTSDAPLWFGIACEETAAALGPEFYRTTVGPGSRSIADVLRDIAVHYLRGTPNGIRVDPESGLVWSPSHFTWMDTNFPAGTPREGYPIEIQALWIRLLRQLDHLGGPAERGDWNARAERALASLQKLYWREERGWFADVLLARPGHPAAAATVDDALRSNFLLALSLGLVTGAPARRAVEAARQYLVVPGALRSLAPLPVTVPLPIRAPDGRLLNDPNAPYWGRYEGDEDTRRKPAYHNGTAWTWTLPVFCEALARAWDFSPEAAAAARAYLGSVDRLMTEGCLGQIPEIVDGDAPHTPRGCDAQAWGVTETLRVWKLLGSPPTG